MVLSFEDSGNPNLAFGLKEARELALAHGFTRPAPAGGAPQPDLDALFAAYGCKALSPFKKRFCSEKLAPPGTDGAVAPQTPTKAAKVRTCSAFFGMELRRRSAGGPGVRGPSTYTKRLFAFASERLRARSAHQLRPAARLRVCGQERVELVGEDAQVEAHHAPRRRLHPAGRLVPPLRGREPGAINPKQSCARERAALCLSGRESLRTDTILTFHLLDAQAKQGDVATERPMWADHGGIDFHGRACWDAWAELKVRVRASRATTTQCACARSSLIPPPYTQGMSRDDAVAKFCRVYAESESDERWSINFHGATAKKLNF